MDRMQRNFEPMRKQVEAWQKSELTDVTAKVFIYEAFVEGKLEAPKHLARTFMICTSNRSMQEGRMFRPLAWTKTSALAFSSLLSILAEHLIHFEQDAQVELTRLQDVLLRHFADGVFDPGRLHCLPR